MSQKYVTSRIKVLDRQIAAHISKLQYHTRSAWHFVAFAASMTKR